MYLARSSPTVLTWFMDASLSDLQHPTLAHQGRRGRPHHHSPTKGQPNIVSRLAKDGINEASKEIGGVQGMVEWCRHSPKGADGVDAPQRPWCARVEVLNTTRGRRLW